MAQAQNQHPLSENELDRLEDLLATGDFKEGAMRLDELQGALCALASGPETVAPALWLPAVLGLEAAYDVDRLAQETRDLLLRFYGETAAALAAGEAPRLLFYPVAEDADEPDYGAWVDGYLYGTEIGPLDWGDAAGEHVDDLAELLDAFHLINSAGAEASLGSAGLKMRDQAAEEIPLRLAAIYNFWRAKRTPVPTLRREAPKVGRNDPCPCGSGRKFKQCCGNPNSLH